MSIPSYEYSNETGYLTPVEFDAQQRINEINSLGNINANIANIQAESQKKITKLNNKTQLRVANKQMKVGLAGAEAVKYTADQGLAGENVRADATRYIADRQIESNLGVENIRAKGALDLQGIVNAGMKRIENIRGEYGIKGETIRTQGALNLQQIINAGMQGIENIRGEYGIKGENIRAKGALDLQQIANTGTANVENIRGEYGVKGKKIDRSTAILGGLVSAFNF